LRGDTGDEPVVSQILRRIANGARFTARRHQRECPARFEFLLSLSRQTYVVQSRSTLTSF